MIRAKLEEFMEDLNNEIVDELQQDNVEEKMNDCLKFGCTIVAQLQWVQSRLKEILEEEK